MAEKGALNSLLNYRFVKRPSAKLAHSQNSSEDAVNGGTANHQIQTTSAEEQSQLSGGAGQIQPDSSGDSFRMNLGTSSQPSDKNGCSPVFNKKFTPADSATDEPGSNESSPWLSKSTGMNGQSKPKYRRVRTYDSSDCDSDSEQPSVGPSQAGDAESSTRAVKWERDLRTMFPATSTLQIRAAVAAATRADHIEAGVDYLVKGSAITKRKAEADEESDSLPDLSGGPRKRIRIMSGDSDDSQHTAANSASQPDSQQTVPYSGSQSDSQRTEVYSLNQSQEKSIQFLHEAFPTLPRQRLQQVLSDCDWQADQAVIVLSSDVTETNSQSQDSSTHGTRSNKLVKHEALSLSDEEEDYEDEEGEDSEDSADDERSQSKHDMILSFFEEATVLELSVLPGCSRKKAEAILELRPFKTWEGLMEKFQESKQLSYSVINGCHEIIQLRNVVVRLMKQCEQISTQMELVVSCITGRVAGTSNDEEDQLTAQPELLNSDFELKPYQLIGLNWLRLMHSQQLNGILADEMGLGKTIQAISFLAHLKEEGEEGPHVIIVPSSTIENWLRELALWCPALSVIVYYGSQEERRATRHSIMYGGDAEFNVLLTTYNMATGGVEDRALFKKFQFHYAVFDEGHMLKNMSSLRFQNLMKISAERRLLLTGTPLQNNLLELMSLLCFVMPDIFQGKTEPLKKLFSMITKGDAEQGKYEKERIAQAQRIMRPFVLRRLKKDVLTQLPKKQEHVEYCPLLPEQQELYDSLLQKLSQEEDLEDAMSGGGMAIFMQLRKAANHPLLLRNHFTDSRLKDMANALAKEPSHRERGALPKLIQEDMSVMHDFELMGLCKQYKKHLGKFDLPPSVIGESAKFKAMDEMLTTMKDQGDRVLLFSQFVMMLDIVEEHFKQKNLRYLRLDGSTPVTDRQQLIDQFNEDPGIFIFLLSTRAGGLGINLTAANVIILHDIDFNPYNDKQAEDRCHRLGQKRTVRIVRLIAQNTVEEGMLRCAQAKLRLEQDVTNADESDESSADVALLLHEAIGKVKPKGGKTNSRPSSSAAPSPSSSSSSLSRSDATSSSGS